jgi:hypothetical protein
MGGADAIVTHVTYPDRLCHMDPETPPGIVGMVPAIDQGRQRLFSGFVWAMFVILVLFSPATFVVLGWFTEGYRDTSAASEVSHRLHEVVFGILFSLAVVGVVTQKLNPRRNVAGLIQLATTLLTLAVVVTATVRWQVGLLLYLVPLVGVVLLAQPDRPIRAGRVWGWAVALVTVAAVPLADLAQGQMLRALSGAQNHTTHWSAMAATVIALWLLGLVVAARVTGYRVVAISVGLAAAAYGAASLAFPFDASSHRSGFAVALIIWGGAWLLGVALFDHPERRSRMSGAISVVIGVAVLPIVAVLSLLWLSLDDPPNVPHRPNPNHPELMAADIDRMTCLDCHADGIGGAPIPSHSFSRLCDNETCWGGRTDCAGCHRIDPDLGGSTELLEVGPLLLPTAIRLEGRTLVPLTAEDLALLADIEPGN